MVLVLQHSSKNPSIPCSLPTCSSFIEIPSTVAEVPRNWTKGKLLGAGAFGQVRCKLTMLLEIEKCFSVSDTGDSEKNPSSPNRVEPMTFWLLVQMLYH